MRARRASHRTTLLVVSAAALMVGACTALVDQALGGKEVEVVEPCEVGRRRCLVDVLEQCAPERSYRTIAFCGPGQCDEALGQCRKKGSAVDGGADAGAPEPATPFASCMVSGPGRTDCGSDENESCCESPPVSGGTYSVGYNGVDDLDDTHQATVSDFRLDKYEVTVGRFREFVAAWSGGWRPTDGAGKHTHLNNGSGLAGTGGGYEPGWDSAWNANVEPTDANLVCDGTFDTWTSAAGPNERRPITCINWYESYAFCIWDGGFLPSEAEWNLAAAGGSEHRYYPWSSPANSTTIDATYAVYGNNPANVGGKAPGAGKWGHHDLAGNVWEWNLDWYSFSLPYASPTSCIDCARIIPAASRVRRGGGFNNFLSELRAANRNAGAPANRYRFVGLRCSRSP